MTVDKGNSSLGNMLRNESDRIYGKEGGYYSGGDRDDGEETTVSIDNIEYERRSVNRYHGLAVANQIGKSVTVRPILTDRHLLDSGE